MRNPGAEWGYSGLGREPGRAASLIFVACAVGAIAGAGAVFSLVVQPESETSIGAAHPLGSAVSPRGCTFFSKGGRAAFSTSVGVDLVCFARTTSIARRGDRRRDDHADDRMGPAPPPSEPTAVPPERSATTQHDPAAKAPGSSRPKSVPH